MGKSGELVAETDFEDAILRRRPRESVVLLLKLAVELFVICGREEKSHQEGHVQGN